MKYCSYILSLISVLIFSSCEEVIQLDLNDVEPRLVIEAAITDKPGPYTVKISQSADFYSDNTFPPVSGAKVVISDDQDNKDVLTEIKPGVYETSAIQGRRGITYTLEVTVDGKIYSATSRLPAQKISLDSLSFKFEKESIFNKEGYYATAYFNDPPEVDNYYRLNIFVNGEVYVFKWDGEDQTAEDDNFWLATDKFTDGKIQRFEFPHTLEDKDSVYVELHHLGRDTFDYYRTLVDVIDGGGVAPSNPISNFGDEALGYFGAFSVTSSWRVVD